MDKKEICLAPGACCLAHIGILQVFQEEGIRIKKIAGTSAEAINPGYWPENALDIMIRAEEINMRNLDQVKTSRADIKIFPDTKDVGWNELHRLDEMIDSGRTAAKEAMPQV